MRLVQELVNGTSPASGSIAGLETYVHNELAEVGGFLNVTEGDLVRQSQVERSEERMYKYKMV